MKFYQIIDKLFGNPTVEEELEEKVRIYNTGLNLGKKFKFCEKHQKEVWPDSRCSACWSEEVIEKYETRIS